MTKILVVIFITVALFGGVFLYLQVFNKDQSQTMETPQSSTKPDEQKESSASGQLEEEEKPLMEDDSTEGRVKALEVEVADLKKQLSDLKKANNTTSTTTTSSSTTTTAVQAPVYIPLGQGGASSSFDWTTSDQIVVTIDTADYPNYKTAQFEASLRTFQGNGTAYARLINYTDGLAITESQVASSTENYSWVSSNTFRFSSGKKVYRIQLKSLTGYEASVQDARIKINF